MIKLVTDRYYTFEEADELISAAVKCGKCTNQTKKQFYNMICAFDIETTSFISDINEYIDIYLYRFIDGVVLRCSDLDIKRYQKIKGIKLSRVSGVSIDEFYSELRNNFGNVFPETYDPAEQLSYIIMQYAINKPNEDVMKHSLVYCWQFAINGKVIFDRDINNFVKLIQKLKEYTEYNKKHILIYVHNLAFEFQFIRHYFKWDKVFSIESRKPLFAITGGVEFRCSYLLTNYSLAKLAEQLKIYKIKKLVGELDYSRLRTPLTKMSNEEIQYCINDVLVVSAYIQECILEEKYIYNIPYTATGYCRRYTRNACLYKKGYNKHNKEYVSLIKSLTLDVEEYIQIHRCFQGGFTHASFVWAGYTMKNCDSFDFTSSYPYVLLSEKFPMSKGKKVKPKDKEEFYKYNKYYCTMFDICFKNIREKPYINEHIISGSKCFIKEGFELDNGRLVSAAKIAITITNIDFEMIDKFYDYDSFKVENMYIYKKDYLPKELIQSIIKLYKDKTELKGVKGKEQEYLNGKSLLNSVFGMMVTDISKDSIIYNDEWDKESADVTKDIERYNHSKKRFLFYPWGVWCTAYARRNLQYGILEFGNDYIYSDTDSLKVKHANNHMNYINRYNKQCEVKLKVMCKKRGIDYSDLEPKTIKGIKKPIGVWDYETKDDPYIKFKTLGAKRYLTYQREDGYHLTVAGVNKNTALPYMIDEFGEHVFDKFDNGLLIPEEHTGKLTHCYIDELDEGDVIDDDGNKYHYSTPSGIYLEKAPYSFDCEDYFDYIKGVRYHK